MTSKTLQGKIAVITGASRGMGAAIAELFWQEGATVILVGREQSTLHAAIDQWHGPGKENIYPLAADLSQILEINRLHTWLDEKFPHINIWVNNAAGIIAKPFVEISSEEWQQLWAINVTAPWLCCQYAFKRMSTTGGSIINITSLSGVANTEKFAGFSAYVSTKAALSGMTEALGAEGKAFGIRVNAIAPGTVDTQMLHQVAPDLSVETKPKDIAPIALFLADDKQSGVMTGSIIPVFCNP
ncbi:MAG: SDR family oxidoreductase [Pseudomonadota bacterium]